MYHEPAKVACWRWKIIFRRAYGLLMGYAIWRRTLRRRRHLAEQTKPKMQRWHTTSKFATFLPFIESGVCVCGCVSRIERNAETTTVSISFAAPSCHGRTEWNRIFRSSPPHCSFTDFCRFVIVFSHTPSLPLCSPYSHIRQIEDELWGQNRSWINCIEKYSKAFLPVRSEKQVIPCLSFMVQRNKNCDRSVAAVAPSSSAYKHFKRIERAKRWPRNRRSTWCARYDNIRRCHDFYDSPVRPWKVTHSSFSRLALALPFDARVYYDFQIYVMWYQRQSWIYEIGEKSFTAPWDDGRVGWQTFRRSELIWNSLER